MSCDNTVCYVKYSEPKGCLGSVPWHLVHAQPWQQGQTSATATLLHFSFKMHHCCFMIWLLSTWGWSFHEVWECCLPSFSLAVRRIRTEIPHLTFHNCCFSFRVFCVTSCLHHHASDQWTVTWCVFFGALVSTENITDTELKHSCGQGLL